MNSDNKMTISCTSNDNPIPQNREMRRNLLSFWIIGLCNNFGYVVMLSAAFDILKEQGFEQKTKSNTTTNISPGVEYLTQNSTKFHCNTKSTGVILLADVLPGLIVKLTAPMYMQQVNYHIRFALVLLLFTASLIILAFSPSILVSILAVVLASLSSCLGEITFLSLSSHFKRSTVSAWSSGTGMAGVTGSLSYAVLRQLGLSKRTTVLVLLVVPCIFAISIWVLLKLPVELRFPLFKDENVEPVVLSNKSARVLPMDPNVLPDDRTKYMSPKRKFQVILELRKYMIPLFLVYLAEYSINQGLYELLYYDVPWLTQAQQYRWFQVDYQVAVFLSRSSVYLFHIKKVMLLSVTQCILFVILLLEVYYSFIPFIWITLALVFVEGLIGGAVYVNTFFRMSEEVESGVREFALGATSVSDTFGVAVAGGLAMPLHTTLCALKMK